MASMSLIFNDIYVWRKIIYGVCVKFSDSRLAGTTIQKPGLSPMALAQQRGMETAGVVEAVGDGVTHLQVGDRAALMASFGNAAGPVAPFAPGLLGTKGSRYVTRQTLFTHIATRESTQAMADDLFEAVTSGKVKIHVDQGYKLEDVQQAHRDLEACQTITGMSQAVSLGRTRQVAELSTSILSRILKAPLHHQSFTS